MASNWNLFGKKSKRLGGILFCGCSLCPVVPNDGGGSTRSAKRSPVIINGKRAKTVDIHAHCLFQEAMDLLEDKGLSVIPPTLGAQEHFIRTEDGLRERIRGMDEMGIDVEIISVNPYWYGLEREVTEKICAINNECLTELNNKYPDRLYGFASLAMQFPDLAVKQLEEAMTKRGLKGAAIGGSVLGDDFANPRFHPVLAKAEELGATLFIHPQSTPQLASRFKGNGWLANTIGNPLDTTIALEKLIFEGIFDKYPKLKILAAHGGGFLGSYAPRMDVSCRISPSNCNPDIKLKKKPSEYLNQIYFDALVFTGEALRHLAAQVGASQIMIGTDWPIPWELDPVGHIMNTPELTDDERFQILGGNANRVLNLDLYKDA
jgi:aminocarboxymuconate-semialdehyde decarboxylase